MHGGVRIGERSEVFRNDCIDERPRIGVARAIGVGVAEVDSAVPVSSHIYDRIARVRHRKDLPATGIREGIGCRRDGLVCTHDFRSTVLRHSQSGQFYMVGVGPVLGMSGTVGEGVGVHDIALAAVEPGAIYSRLGSGERIVASIRDIRDICGRDNSTSEAADGVKAVGDGNGEVLRRDMVGIIPCVWCSIDLVMIDERGVTAAIDERGGVGARFKRDGCAAVGDGRQGGGSHFAEAVNRGLAVIGGRESAGDHMPSISPDRVMSCAVGVCEAVDDCTRAVLYVGDGVEDSRSDGVAAYILDRGRCCSVGVGDTWDGVGPVGRDVSDGGGHVDLVGVGPGEVQAGAVGVGVGVGLGAAAGLRAVGSSLGGAGRVQGRPAGVLDDGERGGCGGLRNAGGVAAVGDGSALLMRGFVVLYVDSLGGSIGLAAGVGDGVGSGDGDGAGTRRVAVATGDGEAGVVGAVVVDVQSSGLELCDRGVGIGLVAGGASVDGDGHQGSGYDGFGVVSHLNNTFRRPLTPIPINNRNSYRIILPARDWRGRYCGSNGAC